MYDKHIKLRDDVVARQGEMDTSAESIQELIENLDRQKDQAIERTFQTVSQHFEEIFEKLVPAGRGRLIMNRQKEDPVRPGRPPSLSRLFSSALGSQTFDLATQNAAEEEDSEDEDGAHARVESYTGVSIKVRLRSV